MEATGNYGGDTINRKVSRNTKLPWINAEGEQPKSSYVKNNNLRNVYDFLNSYVEENKRYNVSFDWGRREGHIATMYKKNGELKLYDPQVGKEYDKNNGLNTEYLMKMKKSGVTEIYRIDDCSFNPKYMNELLKKK